MAKLCTNCHKAEPGVLRGHFDNVSFKTKMIQVKIDEAVELLKFDEATIKVTNEERKVGDGELLKGNKVKKGHEILVRYEEANGVKTAKAFVAKPPVELPKGMLMSTEELEKLVAQGAEKGKYFLYDSRPAPRFQEGTIPTAVNLPYPAFDKLAEKLLPADKNAMLIFFCSGVTCNMSPGSATKAQKLGYKNLKVYKEGMPAWSEKNFGVITPQFMKDAYKDLPYILLDARSATEAATGFISGAVTFPAPKAAEAAKSMDLMKQIGNRKAPVIVYDTKGGIDAVTVAQELLKAKYANVKILTGGFDAWKAAKFDVATGVLASKVVYVPKLRAGEIGLDDFRKLMESPPAGVLVVDVRSQKEAEEGKLPNSIVIPLNDIKERIAEFPKDKQIVLHCNTGVMAEMAFHTLKELGITNVKFVNAKFKFEKDKKVEITKDL
jgi:rhodanese-related sulfurtransferase